MKKVKYVLSMTALLLSVLCTIAAADFFSWPVEARPEEQANYVISTTKGKAVTFSAGELEKKLGLQENELTAISFTALPKEADGALFMGLTPVKLYTRIPREAISQLLFVPTEKCTKATISFVPECADSVKTTISIQVLEKANNAPTCENGQLATQKNIPVTGSFSCYDADGDNITVKIVSKPEKGEIKVTDTTFQYIPYLDMTGTDAVEYCVEDAYGNLSQVAKIAIQIENPKSAYIYADMMKNPSHYSAIKLREKGILSGERVGSQYLFYPDKQVTRGEFIVMMAAAYSLDWDLSPVVNTGLTNDSSIPVWLKPYVKLMISRGVITEKKFIPDQVLTRAEAVVLIDRMAKIPKVEKYNLKIKDVAKIPSWALSSYINLSAYRMLDLYDNNANPQSPLTRDTASDMIWQLWKYKDAGNDITLK